MSKKMSNAPVYYALAQAHFNPVAAMSKYVNQIQDSFRRKGYPLFEPQKLMQLVVPGQRSEQGQLPEPQIQQTESWLMTKSDRTAGFILGSSTITYHTTHYETHKEFIHELLQGLSAVHDVVSLDHVSRLGLRYLDAVLPREGENTNQYLEAGLHGIKFDKIHRNHTMMESVYTTDTSPLLQNGTMVIRVFQMTAPLGYPADMLSTALALAPKFESKDIREHAVIDSDHYVIGLMPVETEKLNEQLLSLRATLKSAFTATTTDHARRVWA